MTSWALSLRRFQAKDLARLYDIRDVVVADAGELVWARGTGSVDEADRIRARLPAGRWFELLPHDRLRPKGRLLPTARLPELTWIPLRTWLTIDVPIASLPGELSERFELVLVRAEESDAGPPAREEREEILLCPLEPLRRFLQKAPAHRLLPLRFAVNPSRREALVSGTPLPSVPGDRYLRGHGIATPVGYRWTPPVGPSVVRAWLGIQEGTFVLWRADGTIAEISESAFSPASRRSGWMS